MIILSSTAGKVLAEIFNRHRRLLSEAFDKHLRKRICSAFDRYVTWALSYIRGKLVVFKYHFNELWSENWYYIRNSKSYAKIHNTATLQISEALREFGEKYGWLKQRRCHAG